ncbi:MAG: hypothetical protein DWP95_11985 [Proteobacteria bacterium]|nr:MAG: hypothetical protein DWP95_11985 [Pseudomonadota bacterium]
MNASNTTPNLDSDELSREPERIIKRNLHDVAFDLNRLDRTLTTIRRQHHEFSREKQLRLQAQILRHLKHKQGGAPHPSVLQLQDAIEHVLLANTYIISAKYYINHRAQRRFQRQQRHRFYLLIQAMREEIIDQPTAPAGDINQQSHKNWSNLCLSLFAQILNQVFDPNSESLELSEDLKLSLIQLPAEVLDALLTKVEEIIRP